MCGSRLTACAAFFWAALASGPPTLGGSPAEASEITAESNANAHMNLAGRQRMLTQQLARNACFVMAGVEPERFAAKTEENVQQFNGVLVGLRAGDVTLGMLPEEDPGILAALEEVEELWATLGPAARQISAGDYHSIPMAQLITLNTATLKRMHETVLAMTETYQSADIPAAMLKTVGVAGRQRMLTQKVSKEACFSIIGLDGLGAPELVDATVAEFDTAMAALLAGSEAEGILPPPTQAVTRQLETAQGSWQALKDLLQQIRAQPDVDHDTRVRLAYMSDDVLRQMNEAVNLYVQSRP
ncbi:type IV pili methyl-accepting chemotaxis transducer N-terminal domain-containing protein [uncultured Roseobacter sp.]|uniref:type IV pili methyl-accepting chemotaxis transducer N-terminal domain-containing protein n=1 Tax=uncultured Roseobacter sp. TaxID=114847 RepID=UPI00261063E8|nr:type IV pili methyl-accepting chemotaxis transducer N-terminal domain-containing protein [uncultured Roseobacter sp.]